MSTIGTAYDAPTLGGEAVERDTRDVLGRVMVTNVAIAGGVPESVPESEQRSREGAPSSAALMPAEVRRR